MLFGAARVAQGVTQFCSNSFGFTLFARARLEGPVSCEAVLRSDVMSSVVTRGIVYVNVHLPRLLALRLPSNLLHFRIRIVA